MLSRKKATPDFHCAHQCSLLYASTILARAVLQHFLALSVG